jgi:hypothetical protein
MAVAVKVMSFPNHNELAAFCAHAPNNVTTIISIVSNGGQFVLFYT